MNKLSKNQKKLLSLIIHPKYQEDNNIKSLAEKFKTSPDKCIYFDNFLIPERLSDFNNLVLNDSVMHENSTDYVGQNKRIKRLRNYFSASPDIVNESKEFFHFKRYEKPRTEDKTVNSVKIHKLFIQVISNPIFNHYISLITEEQITGKNIINLHMFEEGDFLGMHNDYGHGQVCLVIYLHQNWRPKYKGRLFWYHKDGSKLKINPIFN